MKQELHLKCAIACKLECTNENETHQIPAFLVAR